MKLRCFFPCWGAHHIYLFENALLKSLLWERNQQTILRYDTTWDVVTRPDTPKLLELLTRIGDGKATFMVHEKPDPYAPFLEHIKRCLEEDAVSLILTPDMIHSDGSFETALKVLGTDSGAVCYPHMRVVPDILPHIPTLDGEAASLVKLALKHPHPSWTFANEEAYASNTWLGGIGWQKISDKIYAVQHFLPCPFVARYNSRDLEFFEKAKMFRVIDHDWASMLMEDQRLKVLGSSDLAFAVEVTKLMDNCVGRSEQKREYHKSIQHNLFNKQIRYCFRSD